MPAEGSVEDLPLHGVGVLELVNQHDPPPAAHPVAGRGIVALEGVGQPAQQVVVAEDPEPALAAVDLGAYADRELDALGRRTRLALGGDQDGLRVADRVTGQGQRVGAGEGRLVDGLPEPREVEIVDHLDNQVVE